VKPFSVYTRFLAPDTLRGREVLFQEGKFGNKMIVRKGGTRFDYITTAVAPDSSIALRENRYPINEIGILNLTQRLIEQGRAALQYDDVQVRVVPGARINDRSCTLIQLAHPQPRDAVNYQCARILIDDEMRLPVHYEAFDWPEPPGEESKLIEQYTYSDIRLNVGLTDLDFDHRNEDYLFLKSFEP
jgi:hypothetical protein